MNRKLGSAVMAFILIGVFLAAIDYSPNAGITAFGQVGTSVGGILWENTTWTATSSPYTITSTIQIPSNVTLTIEPGVVVETQMFATTFLLHGTIVAHGTLNNEIVFDRSIADDYFNVDGSPADAFLDMEYCVIKNGRRFWGGAGYGHFSLRNCKLLNQEDDSYIWYPEKDILIEGNIFINTSGFSVGHSHANVTIKNNLFIGKHSQEKSVISNWASYYSSMTIVKFNSFLNMNGTVLELDPGYPGKMIATENYWGTDDTDAIDSMIYDMNDDITCPGFIDYLPILLEPHPDTPTEETIPDLPSNLLMVFIIICLSAGALVIRKKHLKTQN